MKHVCAYCCMAVLLALACLAAQSANRVLSVDQAMILARQYVGIDQWQAVVAASDSLAATSLAVAVTAEMSEYSEDRTPFFHHIVASGNAWHVQFTNMRLGPNDLWNRTLDVYLDSSSGSLVTIVCRTIPPDTTIRPAASAEAAEKILRSTNEIYELAGSVPALTLFDISNTALQGNLYGVREFTAQFVRWTFLDHPPRFVWVLTLRGLQPYEQSIPPGGKAAPDWERDSMRFVIDGATGKRITSTNYPWSEAPSDSSMH